MAMDLVRNLFGGSFRSKPPSSDLVETPDSVRASLAPAGELYSSLMLYLAGRLAPRLTLTPSEPSAESGLKRGGLAPGAPCSRLSTQSLTQSVRASRPRFTEDTFRLTAGTRPFGSLSYFSKALGLHYPRSLRLSYGKPPCCKLAPVFSFCAGCRSSLCRRTL